MSGQYLLPCTKCDQNVVVEPAQAGQQVACACGQALEVPTLGALRRLEPAPTQSDSASVRWTRGQTYAFLVGLVLTILALFSVPLLLLAAKELQSEVTTEMDIEMGNEQLENLTLEQSLELWKVVRDQGLGEQVTPQYVLDARRASNFRISAAVLAAAGVLGLLLMIGAVFKQLTAKA